ncbi:MAG: hypothetical protein Q4C40_06720 [Eubacteriales bacterium]|nr:hypothetical protein [Eubacteriales bacterium]
MRAKIQSSRTIGMAALFVFTVLALFGIHLEATRLDALHATPEYKIGQFLKQYGWSANHEICELVWIDWYDVYGEKQLEEIAQANAAVGLLENTDFFAEKNLLTYVTVMPMYIETQEVLDDTVSMEGTEDYFASDYRYEIYCFLDGDTQEVQSAFIRRERVGSSEPFVIYPLTLSAEEVADLPR